MCKSNRDRFISTSEGASVFRRASAPPLASAALAVLTVLSLSACNGDAPAAKPEETPSSTPSSTPGPSNSASTPDQPSTEPTPTTTISADDLTTPGTELKFGEPAVIAVNRGADELLIRLVVTAIDPGTAADLVDLELNEETTELAPFYIQVSGQLISGNPDTFDPASLIRGVSGKGPAAPLITGRPFPFCNSTKFSGQAKPGTVVASCTVQVVPADETVDGAMFTSVGTDYDLYAGKPLIWR